MAAAIGWWLMAIGFAIGSWMGIHAQDEHWLGGYSSRERRLTRLGHIALVALGALNVFWPTSFASHSGSILVPIIGYCFLFGALTMGPVCFLSAWNWRFRFLLVIPATLLLVGATLAGWKSVP